MQTELASRMEKIWAMAEIALCQGVVDYGTDGHSRIARLAGMSFKFLGDHLVRVRGPHLDISVRRKTAEANVAIFPGARTIVDFLLGDDAHLTRSHAELLALQATFSTRRAA
jgi:hypothetical protein